MADRVLLADSLTDGVCRHCHAALPLGAVACPRCGQATLGAAEIPDLVHRLGLALGPQFKVIRLVGRGGFAEVYEVEDTELRRRLAVKVLRTDIAWGPDMATRFKQEARAIAQLSHPHTVPIHYVGEGEGLVFYVMPFIEGMTLADILRSDGPIEPQVAASVVVPILEALDHAHRLGIVHRDIKPENILVDGASGRPLLVDFGISTMRDSANVTDGLMAGTPHYMSPEQVLGERDVDARADLYAVGAVLVQMVTGHPPFEGETPREIMAKHIADPLRLPSDEHVLPDWLRQVVTRALQKRREDRFASADEMLDALRVGLPDAAQSVMTGTHAIRSVGRDDPTLQLQTGAPRSRVRPGRLLAGAAVVAGVAALGVVIWTALPGSVPRFVVHNSLLAPVAVSVNGASEQQLGPGDSMQVALKRGDALAARWRVVGPRSPGGDLQGESLGGTIADPKPTGNIRREIAAQTAAAGYLAPRVMNATSDTLMVVLRDSSGAELPCDCRVAPGGSLFLGYRRNDRLRSVDVRNSTGRILSFESLLARKNGATGEVALSIQPADFYPPRTLEARGSVPAEIGRMLAPSPELRVEEPQLITDPAVVAADTLRRRDTTSRPRDPLAPIFHIH